MFVHFFKFFHLSGTIENPINAIGMDSTIDVNGIDRISEQPHGFDLGKCAWKFPKLLFEKGRNVIKISISIGICIKVITIHVFRNMGKVLKVRLKRMSVKIIKIHVFWMYVN